MTRDSIFILILIIVGIIIFIWNQSYLKCVTGETCPMFQNSEISETSETILNIEHIKNISKFYNKSLCWRNSLLTGIIIIALLTLTGFISINYKSIIMILIIVFTVNYFYCNYWDYHYYKPGFEKIQELTN